MISQNKNNPSVTHTDFMNFVDPFWSQITEKRYQELTEEVDAEKEAYEVLKLGQKSLFEKLCGSLVLNKEMQLPSFEYETEMLPIAQIKSFDAPIDISEISLKLDNNNLERELSKLIKEFKEQIKLNNEKRLKIKEILPNRIKCSAYFKFYELIYKDLFGIYSKRILKKKKKIDEFEDQYLEEYLKRYEEFIEVFGEPEQFSDNEMIYEDIFEKCEGEEYLP